LRDLLVARQVVEAVDALLQRAADRVGELAYAEVEIVVEQHQVFVRLRFRLRGRRPCAFRRFAGLALCRRVELRDVDSLGSKAQHREKHETRDEKESRRTDEALAFAGKVCTRKKARAKQ